MNIFREVVPVVPEPIESAEQKRKRKMRELLDELHSIDGRLKELETIAAEPTRLARRREMVLEEFAALKGAKNA